MPSEDMLDLFATKKRLLLLDAGLDPHVVERIVDTDIKQIRIMAQHIRNEIVSTTDA